MLSACELASASRTVTSRSALAAGKSRLHSLPPAGCRWFNGQPAFAVYERFGADARWTAHSIHVLALDEEGISTLTLFAPPTGPQLFAAFGLPLVMQSDKDSEFLSTPLHP